MYKFFKEKEIDKIGKEILNEIYPMEGLNSYFYLGAASVLDSLDKLVSDYDENSLSKDDLVYIINHYLKENEKIKDYFNRLKKDR